MARNFRRKQDEETNYWLSYSDMMAGLLLTFVLVIALTVLHANIQFDMKQQELLGKEKELFIQADALEKEQALAKEQQARISVQQSQLDEQAEKLTLQKAKLDEQEELLTRQSDLLEELKDIMESQQAKLDRIIGVRSELIEALKDEFEGSSLQISVDEKSGAISMDSSILFEYNRDELKDSGAAFLSEFLPRYTKILMDPKYREYVSEIVIEGHTDTEGGYIYNLDLSQRRAYRVSKYCLDEKSSVLSMDDIETLRKLVTANGRSYSDPVYTENGTVNMDASRRVVFKFRLKDEEMIAEMQKILEGVDD